MCGESLAIDSMGMFRSKEHEMLLRDVKMLRIMVNTNINMSYIRRTTEKKPPIIIDMMTQSKMIFFRN
jgi:hypothetical protein